MSNREALEFRRAALQASEAEPWVKSRELAAIEREQAAEAWFAAQLARLFILASNEREAKGIYSRIAAEHEGEGRERVLHTFRGTLVARGLLSEGAAKTVATTQPADAVALAEARAERRENQLLAAAIDCVVARCKDRREALRRFNRTEGGEKSWPFVHDWATNLERDKLLAHIDLRAVAGELLKKRDNARAAHFESLRQAGGKAPAKGTK